MKLTFILCRPTQEQIPALNEALQKYNAQVKDDKLFYNEKPVYDFTKEEELVDVPFLSSLYVFLARFNSLVILTR